MSFLESCLMTVFDHFWKLVLQALNIFLEKYVLDRFFPWIFGCLNDCVVHVSGWDQGGSFSTNKLANLLVFELVCCTCCRSQRHQRCFRCHGDAEGSFLKRICLEWAAQRLFAWIARQEYPRVIVLEHRLIQPKTSFGTRLLILLNFWKNGQI